MTKATVFIVTMILTMGEISLGNPYYDKTKVPKDSSYPALQALPTLKQQRIVKNHREAGLSLIRIGVKVNLADESYSIARIVSETSGTEAFYRRSRQPSKWGSYQAQLKSVSTGKILANDSIGTGKEFRKLVDEITFRFPPVHEVVALDVTAENPVTGKMELVLSQVLNLKLTKSTVGIIEETEIRELKRPTNPGNSIRVNIYSDGYTSDRKDIFWDDATKAVSAMVTNNFPMAGSMHFFAVFSPSKLKLGKAYNLGMPVQERDSFLGLYYPYWDNFGRWYNIVYPTREDRFRRGLAIAPYDYAIILIDSSEYWGVGNFRELTSIPARSNSFTYLLLHEIGHFFGLNEEYEEGGRTELEFAPGIAEPWSQNMTFLGTETGKPKWAKFILESTPLPTPDYLWPLPVDSFGAFAGGYAESPPLHKNHKPGLNCVMDRGSDFCDVCKHGIEDVIKFDIAEPSGN